MRISVLAFTLVCLLSCSSPSKPSENNSVESSVVEESNIKISHTKAISENNHLCQVVNGKVVANSEIEFDITTEPLEVQNYPNAKTVFISIKNISESRIELGKFYDFQLLDKAERLAYQVPEDMAFAFSSNPKVNNAASVVYGFYNAPFRQLHIYEDEYIGGFTDYKYDHIYKVKNEKITKANSLDVGDITNDESNAKEIYTFNQTWTFEFDHPYIKEGYPESQRTFKFHVDTISGAILLKSDEAYYAEMQPWVVIAPDGNYFQGIIPEHGERYVTQYFSSVHLVDNREYAFRKRFQQRMDSIFLDEFKLSEREPDPLSNDCNIDFPCYNSYTQKPYEGMSNIDVEQLILATQTIDFSPFYMLYKSNAVPEGGLFLKFFGIEMLPGNKFPLAYEANTAKGKSWYKITCITPSNERVVVENVQEFLPYE